MEIFNLLFLLLVLTTFRCQVNKGDGFCLPTCNVLKGIAILGVFVGHLSKEYTGWVLYKLFCSLGLFSVALFFFISGYGIMYGLMYKPNYAHRFLQKRVVPLLATYFLVVVLWWFAKGTTDTPSLRALFFCGYTPFAWYLFAIVCLYLFTWVSWHFSHTPWLVLLLVGTQLLGMAVVLSFCEPLPYPMMCISQWGVYVLGMLVFLCRNWLSFNTIRMGGG